MPRQVDGPLAVHVVYEREAYAQGLVFDAAGRFRGALSRRSLSRLRRAHQRRPEPRGEASWSILDPKEQRAFDRPWEQRAIDNFNRYFSRAFREGSPLVDSDELFREQLWYAVGARPDPPGRVLDLGAGSSGWTAGLAPPVVALDVSPGRRQCRRGPPAAGRVTGSGIALPFRDACFSLVLCLFVLEHVANPFAVVAEICRVLAPRGLAILSFPSTGPLEVMRARCFGGQLTLPVHHLRSFGLIPFQFVESTGKIVSRLRSGGCHAVQVKPAGSRRTAAGRSSISTFLASSFPCKYLGPQTVIVATKGEAC